MRGFRSALLAVLLVFAVVPALAEKVSKADEKLAKQEFETAETAYTLGDFSKAIEHYKKAFELSKRKNLLFNIAQAHRLGGDAKQAIFFYETFLREVPNAPNRVTVEGHISALRSEPGKAKPPDDPLAVTTTTTTTTTTTGAGDTDTRSKIPSPDKVADGASTDPTPTQEAGSEPSRPIYKKWWFWAGVGAVVAAGTAIAVVSMSSTDRGEPDSALGTIRVFE